MCSQAAQEMQWEQTYLMDQQVSLKQPVTGLRASTDTVFLAASVPDRAKGQLLDMGCGVGAAGLCAAYRNKSLSLHGVDIQEELIGLARVNAADNGVEADFTHADIRTQPHRMMDVVIANPPYLEDGQWIKGAYETRNTALGHEGEGQARLCDWVNAAYKALKPDGLAVFIHKAEGLEELLSASTGRFGAMEVVPVHSKADDTAKRVILRMRKGRKTPLILHPPIIVHHSDGSRTGAAEDILRGRIALL
mgnify:CR=1 FL=1